MRWRALGVGFVVVLGTTVVGVLAAPPVLLVAGFLGGLAAGYLAGGVWRGLGYGVLVGVAVAALGAGLGWWFVTSTENPGAYPGGGMVLVVWWVMMVLNGIEVALGGLVGGVVARFRAE